MITILVRKGFARPVEHYLDGWATTQRQIIKIAYYEEIVWRRSFEAGTYIFADLERLTAGQHALASRFADVLEEAGPSFRILNHPARALRRFDLLRTLHARGINDFNVYRVGSGERPVRYPVFLRLGNVHSGPKSRLINSSSELDSVIAAKLMEGLDAQELMIIEFCDTSRGRGFYELRSCIRIGGMVFPHHMHRNRHWIAKLSESREHADEELRFLRSRQCAKLRPIFDSAGIDYGRVDYGLLDGRVQVFEINTNPIVLRDPRTGLTPASVTGGELVARRLRAAFSSINLDSNPTVLLEVDWAEITARSMGSRPSGTSRNRRPTGRTRAGR